MISTVALTPSESIIVGPMSYGVRLKVKIGLMEFARDLPCEHASALLFGLEMALEASNCAKLRDTAQHEQ